MVRRGLERATEAAPGRRAAREVEGVVWGPRGRGFFGVPGIDDLLPVGMSYDSQVMLTGDTGIGKTVLAAQFIYEGLLVGDTCIFIACDEPPEMMRLNMANFRLGTIAYERTGRLLFVDAYAHERSRERLWIPEPGNLDVFFAYEREALERNGDHPVRLVVDSISTIFGTLDRDTILAFNRDRLKYLRSRRVLTLDAYVLGLLDEQAMAGLSHAYPLILKMGFREDEGGMHRYLQLGKMRSGQFSGERHQFRIDPRVGIVVQR